MPSWLKRVLRPYAALREQNAWFDKLKAENAELSRQAESLAGEFASIIKAIPPEDFSPGIDLGKYVAGLVADRAELERLDVAQKREIDELKAEAERLTAENRRLRDESPRTAKP